MATLSKNDQSKLTKFRLIEVGRRYFTKYGFAQTPSEDIVKAAQVTRGALYHHFNGKEGLFLAILERIHSDIRFNLEKQLYQTKDPFQKLIIFCRTYIYAIKEPDVLQISLIDAQTVLGWHKWNELSEQYSLNLLSAIITDLINQKILKPYQVDSLTHLLSGAMHNVVLWSAGQKSPDIALAESTAALEEMLLSLRVENWDTTQEL